MIRPNINCGEPPLKGKVKSEHAPNATLVKTFEAIYFKKLHGSSLGSANGCVEHDKFGLCAADGTVMTSRHSRFASNRRTPRTIF